MTLDDVGAKNARSNKGSGYSVNLAERGSDSFDLRLVREVIQVVPVKYELDSDVGYIRISSFNDQTAVELKQAIHDIKKAAGPNLNRGARTIKTSARQACTDT